uniref:Uncharacterized protein n=1 Tax=Cacopsylla melanoneura TaxID=428564 RepID=A0A8D8X7T6_9HEMI
MKNLRMNFHESYFPMRNHESYPQMRNHENYLLMKNHESYLQTMNHESYLQRSRKILRRKNQENCQMMNHLMKVLHMNYLEEIQKNCLVVVHNYHPLDFVLELHMKYLQMT